MELETIELHMVPANIRAAFPRPHYLVQRRGEVIEYFGPDNEVLRGITSPIVRSNPRASQLERSIA